MKIILDLKNSFNNFDWESKEELEKYINEMKDILWKYYDEYFVQEDNCEDEVKSRLYDMLDMFQSFEVKEVK